MSGAGSKGSKRRIKAREREHHALGLRLEGKTYAQIGKELGITEQGAHKVVMRALRRLETKIGERAEAVRRMELERLDALLRSVWTSAIAGDLAALDRVLKISKRRAELLGLDAPKSVDVTSGGEPLPTERIIVREALKGENEDG